MKTNYHDHVPLHRLNSPQTLLWLFGGEVRRRMASNLGKLYNKQGGCGVCSATLHLIARVSAFGALTELPAPHRRYEMHQIANKPVISECQCAHFFDPESQGPWRNRPNKKQEHHPFCQFDRTAMPVFNEMLNKSPGREAVDDGRGGLAFRETRAPSLRPDEALRVREALK